MTWLCNSCRLTIEYDAIEKECVICSYCGCKNHVSKRIKNDSKFPGVTNL